MKLVGTTIIYTYLQAAESRRGGEADVWETGEKEKAGKADL